MADLLICYGFSHYNLSVRKLYSQGFVVLFFIRKILHPRKLIPANFQMTACCYLFHFIVLSVETLLRAKQFPLIDFSNHPVFISLSEADLRYIEHLSKNCLKFSLSRKILFCFLTQLFVTGFLQSGRKGSISHWTGKDREFSLNPLTAISF